MSPPEIGRRWVFECYSNERFARLHPWWWPEGLSSFSGKWRSFSKKKERKVLGIKRADLQGGEWLLLTTCEVPHCSWAGSTLSAVGEKRRKKKSQCGTEACSTSA